MTETNSSERATMHGPIMQLGYVVGDLALSAAHWSRSTGAGPFFHMPVVAFEGWTFQGAPQPLILNFAFAQMGDKLLELVEPVGPWPNVFGDHPLAPGECRPHHYAFLVDDLDKAAAHLDAGDPVVTASISAAAGLRFYDCRSALGMHIELVTDCADTRAFFDLAADAAQGWEGSGPLLRQLPGAEDLAS
ncbi:VOC family protein [Novosphingobium sp. Chol11]|uniref:VOC family protein n=1 Tax=Novosphingobium sp. Chol11 TaxID=1385763 RepID=UPI0025FFF99D|nr:VOC family protein [Novosphingobium sp. Chol11]